ncbi:MAG: hypothetical protein JRD05_02980 [Deltaproteobacteria bacterium]|nr:hypothetical protein [Deltaproteobacteria bacterium]
MKSESTAIYNIGGTTFKAVFSDQRIGIICDAFFRPYRCDLGSEKYEIVFKKIDHRLLSFSGKVSSSTSSDDGYSSICLEEGFLVSYEPSEKRLTCLYSEEILTKEENTELKALYLFHDGFLPKNANGIRSTFFWFLEQLGIFRLHAAFAEYCGRDILIAGCGSVGKTTSAINIALNGGTIYCDDAVYFREGPKGAIEIFPEIRKLSVTPKTLEFFPEISSFEELERTIGYSASCKGHISVDKSNDLSNTRRGVPDVLIFPSILDEETVFPRIVAKSAYEGFITMLDDNIILPPISKYSRVRQLDLIEKLTNQVEIFSLSSCRDMKANFKIIKSVLT